MALVKACRVMRGAPARQAAKKSRFRVSLYLITLCIMYYTISNNSLKEEIMDYTANALDLFRQLNDDNKAIVNRQIEILIASQSSSQSKHDSPA